MEIRTEEISTSTPAGNASTSAVQPLHQQQLPRDQQLHPRGPQEASKVPGHPIWNQVNSYFAFVFQVYQGFAFTPKPYLMLGTYLGTYIILVKVK